MAHIYQELDALTGQNASARAQDKEQVKQEIAEYQKIERANTRRQAWIAATGLAMTIVGIVLRILAG